MAELSSFFDSNMVNGVPDRQYDATSWANYFSGFIGNGVSNSPASNLQVTAGTGLSVIVDSGIGYINGYYYNNTEPLTININTANATYPRITSIVIELNLNNREITCKTIDGNAQSNPTAPPVTQTESTYQLQLATVYIPAGATNIGTITDTRADANVCGWVNILVPPENSINDLAPILQGYFMGNDMALGGGYVKDFNTLFESGYYTFASTMGTKNIPANCAYGVVAVIIGNTGISFNENTNWIWQIVYDTNGRIVYRQATGSPNWEWSSWQELATTNAPILDAATLTGITENTGTIQGGQLHWNNFKWSNLDAATLVGDTELNGIILVNEADGAIFYLDSNGKHCVEEAVDGATWFIRNSYTGQNILECAPVNNGADTINIKANVDYTLPITFTQTGGVNFITPTTNQNFGICTYIANSNEYIALYNNTNPAAIIWYNVTTKELGTGFPINLSDVNIDGNTNFMQPPNLTAGLQAMGENLVQYENIPFSVLISTGVTLSGTCEFWLLNGPNLTGESINGAIGVMTVTGSVNSTYTWETDNHFPVDLSQIPNMTAITQTPFAPFQIGAGTGTMYLKGNNRTLNAGTTYTVQALAFQ